MRLSVSEISAIKELAKKHFGLNACVFLFGSRLEDSKRGGDIDLLIQSPNKEFMTVRHKVNFLTDLKLCIGFQKIDVIFDNENLKMKTDFYQSVKSTAILLD